MRINITETDEVTGRIKVVGWFDDSAAEMFSEQKAWNGSNRISVHTGSQWNHEALYHTAGGRWVLHEWSNYVGARDSYRFVTDEQAHEWLLLNDEDDAVARLFGEVEPERGPGRPEIGPAILVRIPPELLRNIASVVRVNAEVLGGEWIGMSRAEAIRRLLRFALYDREAGTDPAQLWRERRANDPV